MLTINKQLISILAVSLFVFLSIGALGQAEKKDWIEEETDKVMKILDLPEDEVKKKVRHIHKKYLANYRGIKESTELKGRDLKKRRDVIREKTAADMKKVLSEEKMKRYLEYRENWESKQ